MHNKNSDRFQRTRSTVKSTTLVYSISGLWQRNNSLALGLMRLDSSCWKLHPCQSNRSFWNSHFDQLSDFSILAIPIGIKFMQWPMALMTYDSQWRGDIYSRYHIYSEGPSSWHTWLQRWISSWAWSLPQLKNWKLGKIMSPPRWIDSSPPLHC